MFLVCREGSLYSEPETESIYIKTCTDMSYHGRIHKESKKREKLRLEGVSCHHVPLATLGITRPHLPWPKRVCISSSLSVLDRLGIVTELAWHVLHVHFHLQGRLHDEVCVCVSLLACILAGLFETLRPPSSVIQKRRGLWKRFLTFRGHLPSASLQIYIFMETHPELLRE